MIAETYKTPGIYRQDVFPAPEAELRTGVPAFLGYTEKVPKNLNGPEIYHVPLRLTLWSQFEENFGKVLPDGYLAHAVRGFFENGGTLCYVVSLKEVEPTEEELGAGLKALEPLDTIDLICAPDIMRYQQIEKNTWSPPNRDDVLTMQSAVLKHCDELGERFAILDSFPGASVDERLKKVRKQRKNLSGINGALYYPWIKVPKGCKSCNGYGKVGKTGKPPSKGEQPLEDCPKCRGIGAGFVPPCGHIAGIYARSDQRFGVHKAPANEALEGVVDLEVNLTDSDQGRLNPEGVNCLRAFPGRGIRVWGARTLNSEAGNDGGSWRYINVRRLFLTAGRWIERNMASEVFEPNEPGLWARITRELTDYFNDLYRQGALKGRTAAEAFYVKCDAETNPPEVREAGEVVTEIGLAPTRPSEFVTVRIIHGSSGVTISGPDRPAEQNKEE